MENKKASLGKQHYVTVISICPPTIVGMFSDPQCVYLKPEPARAEVEVKDPGPSQDKDTAAVQLYDQIVTKLIFNYEKKHSNQHHSSSFHPA